MVKPENNGGQLFAETPWMRSARLGAIAWTEGTSSHALQTEASLDAAKKQEDDDDDQNQSYAARRGITPFPAVRPPRQHAEKRHNQNHDQDSSEHCFLPRSLVSRCLNASVAVLPAPPGRLDRYASESPPKLIGQMVRAQR
jgi:hypothetical protein